MSEGFPVGQATLAEYELCGVTVVPGVVNLRRLDVPGKAGEDVRDDIRSGMPDPLNDASLFDDNVVDGAMFPLIING